MIKSLLFILVILVSNSVYCQSDTNKIGPASSINTIKKNNAPTLIPIGINNLELALIEKDSLNLPVPKPAGISRDNTNTKNDSVVLEIPRLIPYSSYKKKKDQ